MSFGVLGSPSTRFADIGQTRLLPKIGKAFMQGLRWMVDKCPTVAIQIGVLQQQLKTSSDPKPCTYNNFITNNLVSNNYITYFCIRITIEDYGQAFYIRCCDIGRQLYRS